jgi:ABC-type lipoprotein release transport system permease subunit
VVERQALLSHNNNRVAVRLRGVDERYYKVVPIEAHTAKGSAEVQFGEEDRLMLGEEVVYQLGIYALTGSEIDVYSLGGGQIGSILPTVAMHSE